MNAMTDIEAAGCPSGLAPASSGGGTDVSAFVIEKLSLIHILTLPTKRIV